MSNFLFMGMTGLKVAQLIHHVVSILLHEAKPVLGLFYLHLNTIGWSGHVHGCNAEKRWGCEEFVLLERRFVIDGTALISAH